MFIKKFLFVVFLMFTFVLVGCSAPDNSDVTNDSSKTEVKDQNSVIADKIEVIHFHATQQCFSCITVGEYALKTIKENFSEEYADGIITYQDLNVELPENRDIVIKYQAGGSSLFINAIADGEDYIKEDVNVWRLVNDEDQFKKYLTVKLNHLLDK